MIRYSGYNFYILRFWYFGSLFIPYSPNFNLIPRVFIFKAAMSVKGATCNATALTTKDILFSTLEYACSYYIPPNTGKLVQSSRQEAGSPCIHSPTWYHYQLSDFRYLPLSAQMSCHKVILILRIYLNQNGSWQSEDDTCLLPPESFTECYEEYTWSLIACWSLISRQSVTEKKRNERIVSWYQSTLCPCWLNAQWHGLQLNVNVQYEFWYWNSSIRFCVIV